MDDIDWAFWGSDVKPLLVYVYVVVVEPFPLGLK